MGSLMLSFLGLLTSIWAEKFDHAAAVTNFVVTPLSLLSGTFYSVHQLAPAFQAVSHANPFFYVISGFRAGFLGVSDSPLLVGGVGAAGAQRRAVGACYALLKSGWKIKNCRERRDVPTAHSPFRPQQRHERFPSPALAGARWLMSFDAPASGATS